MTQPLQPLSPVKAVVLLESAGWATCGAIFTRGKEVAVVADGVMRIVPADRWAEFMAPAKWGTLGAVEASSLEAGPEEDGYLPEDENDEAWRLEMTGLCTCENPVCSSVLEGGVCRSEI